VIWTNEHSKSKGKGNNYVNKNIWEIQDLYIEEGVQNKEKGRVEEEVILIKPYEASESTSTRRLIIFSNT